LILKVLRYFLLLISTIGFLFANVTYNKADIKKLPNGIYVEINTNKPLNGIYKKFVGKQSLMEIPYKNGKEHGVAKLYYPNRNVKLQVKYQDGKRLFLEKFYENGQLEHKENYNKDEEIEGEVTYYDKDANSLKTSYYFNGMLTEEIEYKNGIAIKGWSLKKGKKVTYTKADLAALNKNVQYSPPIPKKQIKKPSVNTNKLLQKANDIYYFKNRPNDSVSIYQKAAKHGNVLAKIQLAKMYYYGIGVQKNQSKALDIIKKSEKKFEQKILDKDPFAQYLYAYLKGAGIYFTKNLDTEKKYYLKASKQNNAIAQNNLANIYYDEKNFKEALKWYKKSAAKGNPIAYSNVGIIYHYGRGVQQNYDEAKRWYKKAIAFNVDRAQKNLDKILQHEMDEKIRKKQLQEELNRERKEDEEFQRNIRYIQNYDLPSINCSRPSYPSGRLTNSKIKSYNKKSRKFQRCLNNTISKINRSTDTLARKFSSGKLPNGQWKFTDARYIPYLEKVERKSQKLFDEIDDEFDWIRSEIDDLESDIEAEENRRRVNSNSYSPNYNYNQPNYQYIPPKRSYVLPGMP